MSLRLSKQPVVLTEPKIVAVSLVVTRVGTIDIINEWYQAEVKIDSTWTDEQEIYEYNPDKYWNPKIYIKNATQILKEEIKYFIVKNENGTTRVTERRVVKAQFWEKIELHNFPFDIQELSIEVSSKITRDYVKLVQSNEQYPLMDKYAKETFIDQQKWKLFKFVRVRDDSKRADLILLLNEQSSNDHFPHIFISCYVKRRPMYFVFNALMLIFLITVVSLTIFAVDCKLPQNRLQISITLLLTSVMFKWNTNRSLPAVSYLTSLDIYSIGCIIFICVTIIWHAIVGAFWDKQYATNLDTWFLVGFGSFFILFNSLFLAWIVYCQTEIKRFYKEEKEFLSSIEKKY